MSIGVVVVAIIAVVAIGINYVHRRNRTFRDQFVSPANMDEMGLVVDWLKKRLIDAGYHYMTTEQTMLIRMVLAGYCVRRGVTDEAGIEAAIPARMEELCQSYPLLEGVKTESVVNLCTSLNQNRFLFHSGQATGLASFVRGYFYAYAVRCTEPVRLLDFLVACISALNADYDDDYYEKMVDLCQQREDPEPPSRVRI